MSSDAPFPCVWHSSTAELTQALLAAGLARVRRVHTFLLPPGILGGLYAASFHEEGGALHRLVLPFLQRGLLEWELKPFRDALRELGLRPVDGRVEVGRNTGDVLHYFLPSVEDGDSPVSAEKKRGASFAHWLAAAGEPSDRPTALRLPVPVEQQPVLCGSRGRHHYLIRLDGSGGRTQRAATEALGLAEASLLSADSPLCRDIMGEWREA